MAFADITELKTLQLNLEKIIEERTAQLREKKNKLEKYSAALMNILEDIKEEKKRTLKIINNFIDGILILDKEGKIILMNNEAGKILKLDPKNFIGKKMKELIRISELKNFPSLIEDNKEAIRQEICLNNEESEKKFLDVTSIYFSDIKERLIVFHDITREKMIEKIKSEFVSLAAHQLRTPLSAIKWTLRMFLDGDLGMLTQEQTEFIKKTFDSNEKMIALINDLLNVTRIEEGRYLYSLTPFDLIQGTQSVVDSYNEIIKQKKITMNLYFLKKKTSLVVMADKEKIKSVIENLIDNAIKYVLPGGKIEIFLEEKNNEVQFSIKDNGIGIPEDQKNRIFTKFFRAKNVKKIDTEGTGLGLFISKNIIEAHGGKIWFESKEGEGSNFYFILPIKK